MDDLISKEYMKKLGGTCIAARGTDGDLYPIAALDELPPVSCDKSYELWKESYEVLKEEYDSLTKCEDIISRQAAIEDVREAFKRNPTTAIRVMDLIESMPSCHPEVTYEQVKEYCKKRCLTIVTNELLEHVSFSEKRGEQDD